MNTAVIEEILSKNPTFKTVGYDTLFQIGNERKSFDRDKFVKFLEFKQITQTPKGILANQFEVRNFLVNQVFSPNYITLFQFLYSRKMINLNSVIENGSSQLIIDWMKTFKQTKLSFEGKHFEIDNLVKIKTSANYRFAHFKEFDVNFNGTTEIPVYVTYDQLEFYHIVDCADYTIIENKHKFGTRSVMLCEQDVPHYLDFQFFRRKTITLMK